MRYWGGGGMFAFGLFATLLLLAILGLLVFLLVRGAGPGARGRRHDGPGAGFGVPPGGTPPTLDALRILDDRLARGDIDVQDYEARKRALQGQNLPPQDPPPQPPL